MKDFIPQSLPTAGEGVLRDWGAYSVEDVIPQENVGLRQSYAGAGGFARVAVVTFQPPHFELPSALETDYFPQRNLPVYRQFYRIRAWWREESVENPFLRVESIYRCRIESLFLYENWTRFEGFRIQPAGFVVYPPDLLYTVFPEVIRWASREGVPSQTVLTPKGLYIEREGRLWLITDTLR